MYNEIRKYVNFKCTSECKFISGGVLIITVGMLGNLGAPASIINFAHRICRCETFYALLTAQAIFDDIFIIVNLKL